MLVPTGRFYLNGFLNGTHVLFSIPMADPVSNLGFRTIWSLCLRINGLVDDVAIYNRALSAGEARFWPTPYQSRAQ